MLTQKVDWDSKSKITSLIRQLRIDGKFDDALAVCQQALAHFPDDCLFPRLIGDMLFHNASYLQSTEYYVSYFHKMPTTKHMFTEFALRYYKIRRNIASNDLNVFTKCLLNDSDSQAKKDFIIEISGSILDNVIDNSIKISEDGNAFYAQLLNNKNNGSDLIKKYKGIERTDPIEAECLLDKYIETADLECRNYMFDSFVLSQTIIRNGDNMARQQNL